MSVVQNVDLGLISRVVNEFRNKAVKKGRSNNCVLAIVVCRISQNIEIRSFFVVYFNNLKIRIDEGKCPLDRLL